MTLHGMAWYQEAYHGSDTTKTALDRLYKKLAGEVITRIEKVLKNPSLLPDDPGKTREIFRWALNYAGGGVEILISDTELDKLISSKKNKNS